MALTCIVDRFTLPYHPVGSRPMPDWKSFSRGRESVYADRVIRFSRAATRRASSLASSQGRLEASVAGAAREWNPSVHTVKTE